MDDVEEKIRMFFMYGELAVALFIMLVVLMSVVFFSEKYLFPFLEALEERKELKSKAAKIIAEETTGNE